VAFFPFTKSTRRAVRPFFILPDNLSLFILWPGLCPTGMQAAYLCSLVRFKLIASMPFGRRSEKAMIAKNSGLLPYPVDIVFRPERCQKPSGTYMSRAS